MMEKTIAKRVGERLQDYYPKGKLSVEAVTRVKTKPGSSVYRIRLQDRDLYAKEYHGGCSPNIHEMMNLKEYYEKEFFIPKILDYYEDENIVLSEGVKGDTLTKSLLKYGFSRNKLPLIKCSQLIGQAIGSLQNRTYRGTKIIGDLDIYLINEIESEDYFKTVIKKTLLKDIRDQVEGLKSLRTRVAQHHGDPSPHNIIMKDKKTYLRLHLIDHSFQDNATFIDPSLYIVSLELARARYGPPFKKIVMEMEKEFLRVYNSVSLQVMGDWKWSLIKTLNYLHFLLMYAKREKTIMKNLVSSIDRRYLLKQIRRPI